MCKVLLEAGATRDKQDNSGYTPIHLAALNGHPATLRALLPSPPDATVGTSFSFVLV